jgi:hypothetical protein
VGDKGDKGDTGPQGQQGPAGPKGDTGTTQSVVVTSAPVNGTTATASCTAPMRAIGGGGSSTSGRRMTASVPVVSGTAPTGWKVTFDSDGTVTAYAIRAP